MTVTADADYESTPDSPPGTVMLSKFILLPEGHGLPILGFIADPYELSFEQHLGLLAAAVQEDATDCLSWLDQPFFHAWFDSVANFPELAMHIENYQELFVKQFACHCKDDAQIQSTMNDMEWSILQQCFVDSS